MSVLTSFEALSNALGTIVLESDDFRLLHIAYAETVDVGARSEEVNELLEQAGVLVAMVGWSTLVLTGVCQCSGGPWKKCAG